MGSRAVVCAAGALLLPLAACAAVSEDSAGGKVLTVFAAASLTEPFQTLGARFEGDRPGTRVEFNFAGSSALAHQINEGAPADVFASADRRTMDAVADEGHLADEPSVFARNRLEIAVPPGNPADVTGLADLADADTAVALCAREVPCGAAAEAVMAAADVAVTPVTEEEDVRAALTKVRLNEVDAALVYRTDVRSAGEDVEGIAFDEAAAAPNDYPIAVVAGASEPGLAAEWVELLVSQEGAEVLGDAGFTEV
ncbi:MAG: molybdate ABC transporter substrate-binding protein [Nocardiopsaceae bacterium]|nr:molybdate ABC transporter substrate-binding protein [Nocardiopsaceae bacterium]